MKPIYQSVNPAEVALVEGFLREAGIEVTVTNDKLTSAFGEVPIDVSTMPTVWVPDEDLERAEELLAERALEAGDVEEASLEDEDLGDQDGPTGSAI
jgi:hypothetical protein